MYEVFRRALRPGMVVADVGAHEGLFTQLAAALVGPTGRVWAFEPAPANFRVLKRRTSVFPQVTIVRAALSDRSGRAHLTIDLRNTTQHSLFAANVGKRRQSHSVSTMALGRALPADLARLDLVKIDAQGAEPQILRGARPVLKRYHPLIAFELWPRGWHTAGSDPIDVFDSLRRIGYTLSHLSIRRGLLPEASIHEFVERSTRWQSINVLATHRRSVARFEWPMPVAEPRGEPER
jgi:FkbM family methyltransferase